MASYYEKVIQPGETLLHIGRLHWIIYLHAGLLLVLAIAVEIVAQVMSIPYLPLVALALFILWAFAMLGAFIRRTTTEIVITDRRIIYKTGFISRRTVEMNMNKVETVDVMQSIPARIFNYGTVLIR
ncbi:MAG TPA: PH domain-containing protein, partial [Stellaceae bacterium]|nr:PH domain-containing protein [Stellaceae bacterium]